MPADGKALITRYDRLKNDAATHFKHCEEMAPFIAPSRMGIVTKRVPGDKQTRQVYDSTSMMAAELMAQFVAGYTINPAQRWGSMRMQVPPANGGDAISEWLEECRDRMLQSLANSMFYAEAVESMIDWGGFGTGFLLREERPQPPNRIIKGFRGFHYQAKKTGRFLIADGADGLVDTAFDEWDMTARMIDTRFGRTNLPEKVLKALQNNKPDEPFTVVHAVYPRPLSESRYAAGAKKMPWASCWVEQDSKKLIFESGYRSFPGAVFRYHRTPNEVMGRGRGHIAFPDTWTLNTAKRLGLEDWALKIRPPVMVSHDSVIGTLRLTPGGPTSINTRGRNIRDVLMPFETGSNPQVSQIKEEDLRKSIRQVFFVDQILMLMEVNKSEMTAFEFAKKMELLFRVMGPVYGRTEHELLRQNWDGVFDDMLEGGAFSPPPPEIFDTDGRIETVFENPIARAQRAGDVEAVSLTVQDLLPLAQVYPEVWDRIDADKTASMIMEARGFPAKATRNDNEMQQLRDTRLQQQEAQQSLTDTAQVAEAGGKIAPLLTALQGGKSA